MPNDQLALIVSVGLLSIGAMCAGLAAAWYSGRRYAETRGLDDRPLPPASAEEPAGPASEPVDGITAPRPQVRERAIRIVALVFLATAAAFVAVSGWWDGRSGEPTDGAIYLLIAAGTLAVVFLQDLLPRSIPEGVRHWIEAAAALGFLTVLTGLSGGLTSPFFVGFFLVVGGAALSRDGLAPLVLAIIAGLGYGAVGLLVAWNSGIHAGDLALIAFQTVTLVLLAYIGTVAGREQRRAREAALRLARFDPLTGLYNRSHFFASMERELRLAERAGRGFALLMLDLDGLKPVNDTFGHHYGDRLLQGVTEVIQRSVRATDTPARYGGDEFVVLLPETDAAGAYVVAEKLRHDIGALTIRVNERSIRTSVSIGLVAYPDDGTTVEELMTGVDAALYEAKRSGKDRIVGYTTRTERVTTRMGTPAQRPATAPNARTSAPRQHAPWETDTQPPPPPPPEASGRGTIRVVTPAGTTLPPVPRRRVALKVEGDPASAGSPSPAAPTRTTGDP